MNISGIALVIGGGGGIGRACAVLLAKEGSAVVVVADLNIDSSRETIAECQVIATNTGFQGRSFQVDVTQEDSIRDLFRETISTFGRIDYCINCAGIGAQGATDITTTSLAEFQRFLDLNTTGIFLTTREASIAMRAQEVLPNSLSAPGRGTTRGTIVNLGSGSSVVATAGILPYTTSKHAVLGVTKNSALDNAAYGIRVNCVCPTWVDTPMLRRAMEGVDGLEKFIESAVPVGRIATPEEVADVVIFLCSPRSSYITGCSLIVDGGTTLTALRQG